VVFTKVLTVYQLYHNWIHPFYCSLYPCSPDSWNSFNKYHLCIYMHVYTFFAPFSPTHFPWHLPFPTSANPPPWAGPVQTSGSLILQKRKEKKKNMRVLLVWDKHSYKESFCAYMCYTPSGFIFSNYLCSALVPFLWWFQSV
jgi:hypothetical protein